MNKKDIECRLWTVATLFPKTSFDYDNDGQLIIYTGEYDPDEAFDPEHDWTRKSNE